LFSALRGMLRPLLTNNAVALIFAETNSMPTLKTDEGKVSQILRNFISNALKYTEKGEVRVTAKMGANQTVIFSVADTGIGIAPENQTRIFEEFVQVDHPLQKRVKGTGLGLPLGKKLAKLLGGSVDLQSTLGVGSTFSVTLPIVYRDFGLAILDGVSRHDEDEDFLENDNIASKSQNIKSPSEELTKILIIDDEEVSRYTIKSWLADLPCTTIEATDGYEGLYRARTEKPQAILLDLLMPGLTGFTVLEQLKSDVATSAIPVIIVTSKRLEAEEYEQLAAKAVAIVSKESNSREDAIAQLQAALDRAGLNF
jgi:CheY-like chemotaxis protein